MKSAADKLTWPSSWIVLSAPELPAVFSATTVWSPSRKKRTCPGALNPLPPTKLKVCSPGVPLSASKLCEEVACAVVLREGMVVVEQEIRAFASGRLADFKVPRKVVILEEIPKGATGKLQRIGLAQKLGLGG